MNGCTLIFVHVFGEGVWISLSCERVGIGRVIDGEAGPHPPAFSRTCARQFDRHAVLKALKSSVVVDDRTVPGDQKEFSRAEAVKAAVVASKRAQTDKRARVYLLFNGEAVRTGKESGELQTGVRISWPVDDFRPNEH